jgi:hypothetical protein
MPASAKTSIASIVGSSQCRGEIEHWTGEHARHLDQPTGVERVDRRHLHDVLRRHGELRVRLVHRADGDRLVVRGGALPLDRHLWERVGDLREVGDVLLVRVAALAGLEIHHVSGAAVGREPAPVAAEREIEVRVARVQRVATRRQRALLLDEGRVESDPLRVEVDVLTVVGHHPQQAFVRGGDAGPLQDLQAALVHRPFLVRRQDLEGRRARVRTDLSSGHRVSPLATMRSVSRA